LPQNSATDARETTNFSPAFDPTSLRELFSNQFSEALFENQQNHKGGAKGLKKHRRDRFQMLLRCLAYFAS
jgi:hypothetical protein